MSMKHLLSILAQIPADKWMHFSVSAALAGVTRFTLAFFVCPFWAVVIAAAVTVVAGIAKELIWDYAMKQGTPDWRDVVADMAGMIIGLI